APMPAPYLQNQVSSNTSGQEHIERARITCGSTGSTTVTQSGSWITSVTNGGAAGQCSINIATGEFSSQPSCTCTSLAGANNGICAGALSPHSSSAVGLETYNTAAAGVNGDIDIVCMGPR